jgi:hypothetical protein
MNEKMLPKDEMKAGFRVFEPKDLERFLGTLKSEIKEAARTKQPVLALIFGYGEKETVGIFIGCDEGGSLKLTPARLASLLRKEVQTILVLTSCYPGGWIMQGFVGARQPMCRKESCSTEKTKRRELDD